MTADDRQRTLTPDQVRTWYDRFGRKQDSQDFYAGPALDDLVAHAGFEDAARVFEFGCGTGHFAQRLIRDHLPASARYVGCDLSPVMVGLATRRLADTGDRARVLRGDGTIRFPLDDHSVDRVVSNYVLDLLSDDDTRTFFAEAHRSLVPGGRLCLVSLGRGVSAASRMVSSVWSALFRWRPTLVGGCRPIRLQEHADPELWETAYDKVISAFGVPSEVAVFTSGARPGALP